MRAVRVVPGMTAVLVSLVAVAVAGCSAFSSSSPTDTPASSAATASSQASPPASVSAAAPAATPSATSSSGGVENLVASAAVKSELLAAFAAYHNIPVSDVVGSTRDLYYTYDPATNTYWALASYAPASTDPLSVTVTFQDGGQTLFYKKSGSGPWQYEQMGQPGVCSEWRFFPQAVLVAWAMPAPGPGVC
jgi:cytoskeletal protein RodZ